MNQKVLKTKAYTMNDIAEKSQRMSSRTLN